MAEHIGWRSFCWLNIALQGCVLVLLIFFPETKLQRVQTKAMLEGSVRTGAGNLTHETTIERDPYLGQRLPFHSVVQHLPVKTAPRKESPPELLDPMKIAHLPNRRTVRL